jgi:hypothetical protein
VKLLARDIAVSVLDGVDQIKAWQDLIASKDEKIRLQSLTFLTERAWGRAPTTVQLGGIEGGPPLEIIFNGPPPSWAQKN